MKHLLSRPVAIGLFAGAAALWFACDPSLPPAAAFIDTDAGPVVDAGPGDVDSGMEPHPDAGKHVDGGHDAGQPTEDAGTPEVDAGQPSDDAGTPEVDAGQPSDDAGSPEIDAGLPTLDAGPVNQPTGSGCTTDSECAGGTCVTQAPGGYCTQSCSFSTACPSGTHCDLSGHCLAGCQSDNDCRDGYTCQLWSCNIANCRNDYQCPRNWVCDPTQQVCVRGP